MGIYVAVSDVIVGQNTVIDEGLAGYRQGWGILVGSNLNHIIIDPNYISAPGHAYYIGSGLTNSSYRDPAKYSNNVVETPSLVGRTASEQPRN